MSETKFKPVLGLWDATMIVAGSMIGSGIFIVSADIMRNVGSAGWLIGVWAITGFMTITAAVSYGELSGMATHTPNTRTARRSPCHTLLPTTGTSTSSIA